MEPARVVTVPAWTAPAALVLGGDDALRARSAELLTEAGFAVVSGPAEGEPGSLLVLIGEAAQLPLLRDIRHAAEQRPDACILAVVPSGARNTLSRRAILAGARGIVREDDVELALVPTARAILAGQLTVPTALSRQIAPRPLSHREKQIMALIVRGDDQPGDRAPPLPGGEHGEDPRVIRVPQARCPFARRSGRQGSGP